MATEASKPFLLALCSAAAVGIVAIIFVLRWVLFYKEGLAWDGGLAEFNWHPVLVVTGFVFLQGTGEWNKRNVVGGKGGVGVALRKSENLEETY